MTTETKEKILYLHNVEKKTVREVAAELNIPFTTVSSFISTKTVRFVPCPVCGEGVPVREAKGRRAIYCSAKCRNADYKNNRKRRHIKCVCEQCGKEYLQYTFVKSRFCSRSCAMKHRYEKQRVHGKGA